MSHQSSQEDGAEGSLRFRGDETTEDPESRSGGPNIGEDHKSGQNSRSSGKWEEGQTQCKFQWTKTFAPSVAWGEGLDRC